MASVDAYRGNGMRGGSDEDEARTGGKQVPVGQHGGKRGQDRGPASTSGPARGVSTSGQRDQDGASPVPTTEKSAYISYILYLDGQNTYYMSKICAR